jgi:flagellar basal-body rod protein FlgB
LKIGFDAALGPHADALSLRGQRTEVLARNIAHADTPGYLARDIDFGAELAKRVGGAADHGAMRTTHGRHMPGQGLASDTVSLMYRGPLMASFDGNSVDTQTEQAAFAENNTQFQAALRFLNNRFTGLIGAIKGE